MMTLMAEYTAKSATEIVARASVETEVDSVAAVNAGTKQAKKRISRKWGSFFVKRKNLAATVRLNSVGEVEFAKT